MAHCPGQSGGGGRGFICLIGCILLYRLYSFYRFYRIYGLIGYVGLVGWFYRFYRVYMLSRPRQSQGLLFKHLRH